MTNETTPAPRFDAFTPIHKAVRRQLFETAIALARTDFVSAEETAAAARAVAACFTFLREHAEHEDRHVLPVLHALAPGLTEELGGEHVALERAALEVDCQFPRLAPLDAARRLAVGAELARRFNAYVAMQIRHLEREEREVNAVLWAHLTDGAIAGLNARIVADVGPAKLAVLGPMIAASLNRAEREAMAAAQPQPAAAA